jgi:hypothetical protein
MLDEVLPYLFSWRTLVVVLLLFGFAPAFILRIVALAFHRDDPRRQEMLAEVHAVPRLERPFWVAEQLEVALCEGLRDRFVWLATGRLIHRWHLDGGLERNRMYPDSFWIPSGEEKGGLAPGDSVKALFQMNRDEWGERMWLTVIDVKRRHLICQLDCHPLLIPRLNCGDEVKVKREHVIDILWHDVDYTEVFEAERLERAGYSPGPWAGLHRACCCDECLAARERDRELAGYGEVPGATKARGPVSSPPLLTTCKADGSEPTGEAVHRVRRCGASPASPRRRARDQRLAEHGRSPIAFRPRPDDRPPDAFTFVFGTALPADRVDARFVVSVGAALNDLLFLNRLYVPHERWGLLRRPPTESDSTYLARLVVASLFELQRLLGKGESEPDIAALLGRLGADGKEDLRTVRQLGHLRPHYERIRNGSLHYPWPREESVGRALRALVDRRGAIEAVEESMASIRAIFADDVLTQLWVEDPEAEGSEDELRAELEELVRGLSAQVTAAIRLCQHILNAYFDGLPEGTIEFVAGQPE